MLVTHVISIVCSNTSYSAGPYSDFQVPHPSYYAVPSPVQDDVMHTSVPSPATQITEDFSTYLTLDGLDTSPQMPETLQEIWDQVRKFADASASAKLLFHICRCTVTCHKEDT